MRVKQVMTEDIEALRRHGFGVAYCVDLHHTDARAHATERTRCA